MKVDEIDYSSISLCPATLVNQILLEAFGNVVVRDQVCALGFGSANSL